MFPYNGLLIFCFQDIFYRQEHICRLTTQTPCFLHGVQMWNVVDQVFKNNQDQYLVLQFLNVFFNIPRSVISVQTSRIQGLQIIFVMFNLAGFCSDAAWGFDHIFIPYHFMFSLLKDSLECVSIVTIYYIILVFYIEFRDIKGFSTFNVFVIVYLLVLVLQSSIVSW